MARLDSNGKRVNVTDVEFVTEYKAAARNGGTLQGLANKLEMSYGNVVARRTRLNNGFKAAGKPELPVIARASGPRSKDFEALSQVGEDVEVAEGAEVAETVETETVAAG